MRYILADIETTGLKSTDKICELAWVEVDNDFNTVGSGYSLINPEIPIGYAARAVNGISDDMVMDAPTIEQYIMYVESSQCHFTLTQTNHKQATLAAHARHSSGS
jgi:DNA polymerase III epsilon subunit-like protein